MAAALRKTLPPTTGLKAGRRAGTQQILDIDG